MPIDRKLLQKPIPIIVGPTGSGKTAVSLSLARKINGEIISADSRQIYRSLHIGTAKPDGVWIHNNKHPLKDYYDVDDVPHFMVDFLDPSKIFNAGLFANQSKFIIDTLLQKGRQPVVVGGTGLYIRALVDGLAPLPARDEMIRKALTALAERDGRQSLHKELARFDSAAAKTIPPNNINRVLRALEVYLLTGRTLTWWQKEKTKPAPFSFRWYGLRWSKELLEKHLIERCRNMLREGLVEETSALLAKGIPPDAPCFQSLGYKYVIEYLKGNVSKKQLETQFVQETRLYAKRQRTWFNANQRICWVDVKDHFDAKAVAQKILKSLNTV